MQSFIHSLLVYSYHPSGDLPSLVTRWNHSHCLFSYNFFSSLIHLLSSLIKPLHACTFELSPVGQVGEREQGLANPPSSGEAQALLQTASHRLEMVRTTCTYKNNSLLHSCILCVSVSVSVYECLYVYVCLCVCLYVCLSVY